MTIKIAGVKFTRFSQVEVNLAYDSIASTFSFLLYFDPDNQAHRAALKPGGFQDVVIEHNGETLITGTLLAFRFKSDAKPRHLVAISGYSKTGVLEDCQIPTTNYPLQTMGLSFTEIVKKVIQPFGLSLVVDPSVTDACSKVINSVNADNNQTVKAYLSEIAGQLNVVLSHTSNGELLLTGYKTKDPSTILANYAPTPVDPSLAGVSGTATGTLMVDKAAVGHFSQGMPGVEYDLAFDGQKMHSTISVIGQSSIDGGNAQAADPLSNPYVGESTVMALKDQNDIDSAQIYGVVSTIPRPKVALPSTTTDITIAKAQRNILAAELKAIPLQITMRGWTFNGVVIRPGDVITILNPELHIYTKTRFVVESIAYKGNHVKETCTLNCVVPEAFNNDTPKNIFA